MPTRPDTPDDSHAPLTPVKRRELIAMVRDNWKNEIVIARTYAKLAEMEPDAARKRLLARMAENEEHHARLWEERLRELGETVSEADVAGEIKKQERMARWFGADAAIRRIEREERGHVAHYTAQTQSAHDERSNAILAEVIPDEQEHADRLKAMADQRPAPQGALDALLAGETWHKKHAGGWLGDAIYGANDGLGAVFGTVSTVAGATHIASGHRGDTTVLLAGLACTLASSLSMGAGAYLATKAESEVHQAELARERREIETDPEHEREELELMYQLKGFTEDEAKILADRLTSNPDQFLATMAAEELGLSMHAPPNPYLAALSGSVSTALGAIVPLIPFFFLTGITAVIWAGVISLVAHFAIGAAKTLVTGRSWFSSGMEMTIVGVLLAVVTFAIGSLFGGHVAP